ncbi:fructosamine kinase family protein [Salinimonas sp. HHU 13199]|uniref:Fructosamine kinase family protein n=2 Tax=Salinimonas profundi TaxID=2729140 RepID=A0ABR8LF53_9ALTE|nr:fructosamine kinase family protein [Salinimonas profundi]
MWHFISDHISEVTDQTFICQRASAVSGGDTHSSYIIQSDSRRYFVKLREAHGPDQLTHEAQGLAAIASTNTISNPGVVCHGVAKNDHTSYEYLVLQHLHFTQPDDDGWAVFAHKLAALHQSKQSAPFGWPQDNYIGLTRQINHQSDCWATFFAHYRIGVMLENLAHKGEKLTPIDAFVELTEQYLQNHHPTPSLVHGDLWSGNIGFTCKGPVIFDPAVYIGDRETDIAMTCMFGRLPEEFYQHYDTCYSLSNGYQQRQSLYQLYHLLNHALLFGGHYLSAAKSAIIDLQNQ